MKDLLAPLAGAVLVLLGVGMMLSHVRTRRLRATEPIGEKERSHYRERFRRRMQASGMIAVLGVLIAVGDVLPILHKNPTLFGLYWIGVLILTGWVILLALGDALSTRIHARTALRQLQQKQQELERELARLRRRESNGKEDGNDQ